MTTQTKSSRWTLRLLGAALATAVALPAWAEVNEVRIAQQFGVGYLPLQVMKNQGLMEKHAKDAGLGDIKVTWARFGGGAAMNDALISGNLDFASGGVGPLVTIWAKTRGNLDVRGVAALNAMPLYLNTTNPDVKTLADFTGKDKIALPAVKVSIQAVTLQMGAAQAFGMDQYNKLDSLTVSMKHPDGMAALLSGGSEVNAHFTSAPFMYIELRDPKVRKVVSSYEILGGPSTFNTIWARAVFRDENPKTYQAFVDALKEAMEFIKADPEKSAEIYITESNSKEDKAFILEIINDPENEFTTTPKNVMKYADFMNQIGSIKNKPADWSELFFPEVHDQPGS